MSAAKGWGKRRRRGHPGEFVFVVQFAYVDREGRRKQWRQHSQIQSAAGAAAEAKRRMTLAMETGDPRGVDEQCEAQRVPTWSAFVTEYVVPVHYVRIGATPATLQRYADLWRWIEPIIGKAQLDEWPLQRWQKFEADLMQRTRVVKGETVVGVQIRPHVNFVRGTLFKAAIAAGYLEQEQVPKFTVPKRPKKLKACPSPTDMMAVLALPTTWVIVAAALATFTTMRMGEIRALRRKDIDLAKNRINVLHALSADQVSTTKGKQERWVAMHPRLREILEVWIRNMLPLARVVTNNKGKTPGRQAVLAAFKRACRMAGVYEWSFHSIRHFGVTELLRAGVPAATVQRTSGHSTVAQVENYWHGASDDAAVDAVALIPVR